MRDNTLKVVPESRADSGLYGRVIRYENRVFGYNAKAQTEEYEVLIEVELEFKDLVKRKTLWTEKALLGRTTYFVVATLGQLAEGRGHGAHRSDPQSGERHLEPHRPELELGGGAAPGEGGGSARRQAPAGRAAAGTAPSLTRKSLLAELAAGRLRRIYLLTGSELFLRRELVAAIEDGGARSAPRAR